MTFERTTDLELVRQIITNPACYRRMANDQAPPLSHFQAVRQDGIEYIVARENHEPVALFLLVSLLLGTSPEVHFCFSPQCWGRTREVALGFLTWVWANTPYRRLIGPVPAYNRLALRLALAVGFRQFGVEKHAVQKHGKPYDRILLEVLRPC